MDVLGAVLMRVQMRVIIFSFFFGAFGLSVARANDPLPQGQTLYCNAEISQTPQVRVFISTSLSTFFPTFSLTNYKWARYPFTGSFYSETVQMSLLATMSPQVVYDKGFSLKYSAKPEMEHWEKGVKVASEVVDFKMSINAQDVGGFHTVDISYRAFGIDHVESIPCEIQDFK